MGFDALRGRLAGVVAIPVTPFDQHDQLDDAAYAKILTRMVDGGIEVVTPNGNTGEFYALSKAEARQALELTVKTVGDRATVLAGVGHAVPDAIAAARHAQEAGADAIMIHQPVHPYASMAGWIDYHQAIAEAVPDIGVVLYVRNTRVEGAHLRQLGTLAPNVIGVKYAVPDPVRFASVARDAGLAEFVWLAGLAELSAPGYWVTGAVGFTSGLANVVPALSLELLANLRIADYAAAMRVWERIRPFEELRAAGESANNVSVVKAALARLGLCRADVRPPSRPLDAATTARIDELLAGWGVA
jgi:4-hydroxy-tetrahydrodipicolinate synthase